MKHNKFEFLVRKGTNYNGKIKFYNNRELNTPVCWFGLSIIEPKDFQLKVFKKSKIECFLSNVYDLYYFDKKGDRKSLIKELQKLNLKHKMDSGGFQLMKIKIKGDNKKYSLTPQMVLDKQIEIECDIGVQLDFPFGPSLNKIQKMKRLNKTLENLETLLKLIDYYGIDFTFLPVIHTESEDTDLLKYSLNKIENILGELPKIIGVGSLVPLVKTMKGSKSNGIERLIFTLISLRRMLPDSFIHAFGIGGTMSYLAILAGINSYDSNGWIQKAAYGVIQLPGISDRYLKKEKHNRPYLIDNRKQKYSKKPINEIDIFMKCKCSACEPFYKEKWKIQDWHKKQKAFIGRDQKAKTLRSIHNVSLYQTEIIKIRKAILDDKLKQFIKNRLKRSRYYKYIDYIIKSKDIDDLSKLAHVLNIKNSKIVSST